MNANENNIHVNKSSYCYRNNSDITDNNNMSKRIITCSHFINPDPEEHLFMSAVEFTELPVNNSKFC